MSLREFRHEFRTRLLGPTVEHAYANVGGYRDHWRGCHDIGSLEDLARLPVITKEAMAPGIDAWRDPDIPTALIQHTSGTTRRTLVVHRGRAELNFIRDFFSTLIAMDGEVDRDSVPMCISIAAAYHGEPTPFPYPAPVLSVSMADGFWDLPAIVSDPGSLMGATSRRAMLTGLESQLRILTCRLIELGFDFRSSAVTSICTTGDLVTSRLRRWYEETWGVPLANRYSMTEMIGGANQCRLCGFWHCDPHVIAEVVDPFTKNVIDEGYGILVITCLFPFVQRQPFIRYWTGDFVEIGPRDCPVDALGFAMKGRAAGCVFETTPEGTRPLLASADVYDVLDDFPDIATSRMFTNLGGVADHSALGHLKFAIRWDKARRDRLSVLFETRYTGHQYRQHVDRLCETVRTRLLQRHSHLSTRIADKSLEFEVNAALPGQLDSFMPDEVEWSE